MSEFVSGNQNRIFLNTTLGCLCKCAYCYLESVGINKIIHSTHDQIVDELLSLDYFQPGPAGTILSIGCYSECWNNETKKETIKLLKKIASFGNYIQLATKKHITQEELVMIDSISTFPYQIGIFVSAPTISKSAEIELGTDSIEDRLSIFSNWKLLHNSYLVLYIKPVLPGITYLDIEKYRELLKDNPVDCVVGGLLKPSNLSRLSVQVGTSHFIECNEEQDILITALSKDARVYRNSTEIINHYRESDKDEADEHCVGSSEYNDK